MNYTDNDKKFVAVLNRRHQLSRIFNAVCHATAGLSAKIGSDAAHYLDYGNDADSFVASISRYPFIILEAKSSSQLAALQKSAVAARISSNLFVSAMIGRSAEEQIAQTKAATDDALDYVVVVLFGDAKSLNPLTKKFSLYKGPAFAEVQ
ncbi:hypothetical protein XH99_28670 [Bradyrhizobium nanningense]|uniref:DUF2000 domain-containing protein n=1 Tax=Bradyrhizobium nanningense TaxID=1325118 RepID=A0A4Q0RVZ2_9BRAD|nr:DUF2000 domain-containing protein [Bradyrhizobium nanningense]RXH24069.1 hypothetical protein XH99_28670 [Bradyrhizobium nanningense]